MMGRVFETDAKALDLVHSMQAALTSMGDLLKVAKELETLKEPTIRLLKQIIECSIFIREYIQQNFAGRNTFSA